MRQRNECCKSTLRWQTGRKFNSSRKIKRARLAFPKQTCRLHTGRAIQECGVEERLLFRERPPSTTLYHKRSSQKLRICNYLRRWSGRHFFRAPDDESFYFPTTRAHKNLINILSHASIIFHALCVFQAITVRCTENCAAFRCVLGPLQIIFIAIRSTRPFIEIVSTVPLYNRSAFIEYRRCWCVERNDREFYVWTVEIFLIAKRVVQFKWKLYVFLLGKNWWDNQWKWIFVYLSYSK